jgi:2-keto-3-deoxy-L-rhamnonate aldolase RhmA
VAAELLAIKDSIRKAGKHCGIVAAGHADLSRRREQGFTMIGLGLDSGFLLSGLEAALTAIGRECRIRALLDSTG